MVGPGHKDTKIVVVRETSSWESVPQSNSTEEEAAQVELAPYQIDHEGNVDGLLTWHGRSNLLGHLS